MDVGGWFAAPLPLDELPYPAIELIASSDLEVWRLLPHVNRALASACRAPAVLARIHTLLPSGCFVRAATEPNRIAALEAHFLGLSPNLHSLPAPPGSSCSDVGSDGFAQAANAVVAQLARGSLPLHVFHDSAAQVKLRALAMLEGGVQEAFRTRSFFASAGRLFQHRGRCALANFAVLPRDPLHGMFRWSISVCAEGTQAVVVAAGGSAMVQALQGGQEYGRALLFLSGGPCSVAAMAPDGRRVVALYNHRSPASLHVYNVDAGANYASLACRLPLGRCADVDVYSLAVSPDHTHVALLSTTGTPLAWDLGGLTRTAVPIAPLAAHEPLCNGGALRAGWTPSQAVFAFAATGRHLVALHPRDCQVAVWDLQTGTYHCLPRKGPEERAASIQGCSAMSRCGRCLVSVDPAGTVHFIDLAAEVEVTPLDGCRGPFCSVGICSVGPAARLATAELGGFVSVWHVSLRQGGRIARAHLFARLHMAVQISGGVDSAAVLCNPAGTGNGHCRQGPSGVDSGSGAGSAGATDSMGGIARGGSESMGGTTGGGSHNMGRTTSGGHHGSCSESVDGASCGVRDLGLAVCQLEFAPDGARLAVVHMQGADLLDIQTGRRLRLRPRPRSVRLAGVDRRGNGHGYRCFGVASVRWLADSQRLLAVLRDCELDDRHQAPAIDSLVTIDLLGRDKNDLFE